jgi:hypothetical protein
MAASAWCIGELLLLRQHSPETIIASPGLLVQHVHSALLTCAGSALLQREPTYVCTSSVGIELQHTAIAVSRQTAFIVCSKITAMYASSGTNPSRLMGWCW